MRHTRIFQAKPLKVKQTLSLDKTASHHLSRVLRVNLQDTIILFNGDGCEYDAVIEKIERNAITVTITAFKEKRCESPVSLHLAQGMAKGEKMDWIIQKSVELGVQHITPLETERSHVKLAGVREAKRLEHWQAIARGACEQSGRNTLPEIHPLMTLADWLNQDLPKPGFVLSPAASIRLEVQKILPQPINVLLLIGPEGGLTEQEIRLATQHDFQLLKLGPRVLRTETAAIAAISIMQYCFGDF